MTFDLTAHNDSLLHCQVNVTQHPGLALSICHGGDEIQTLDSAPVSRAGARHYVTFSDTISVRWGEKYECQLYLNKHLITKRGFDFVVPGNNFTSQLI